MTARRATAGALLVALIGVGACTNPPPPSVVALPSPSMTRAPSLSPTASPTPDETRLPSPGAFAPIDPTLLVVLPVAVEGLPVEPAPDALADAVGDPAIVRNVQALAAAIAVNPATGEFAYATVLRFFDGVMTDPFFRTWRDSFDEGVCAQAGGVSGTAEADIGGRPVFIGSCAGGVRTYHAWLGNHGVLVSVSSVGERRLGEQLVEGLRD